MSVNHLNETRLLKIVFRRGPSDLAAKIKIMHQLLDLAVPEQLLTAKRIPPISRLECRSAHFPKCVLIIGHASILSLLARLVRLGGDQSVSALPCLAESEQRNAVGVGKRPQKHCGFSGFLRNEGCAATGQDLAEHDLQDQQVQTA